MGKAIPIQVWTGL